MKRYLTIYLQLANFSLKSLMSYRINLLLLLANGPAYSGVMYGLVLVAFHNAPVIAGWTDKEGLLLFSVFGIIYTHCLILFIDGLRHFLWRGIRLGELDFILTKPVAPQFMVGFARPSFSLISLELWMGYLFVTNMISFAKTIPLERFSIFMGLFLLSHILIYLTLSSYSTLGFFVIKAQQIIEIFDKTSDFAIYPMGVFPFSFQLIMTTILPIAFFAYIPTALLLGKLPLWWAWLMIGLTIIFWGLNRILWRYGLRHYSSASS